MSTKMDEKELNEMPESKEEKSYKATIQTTEDGEYFLEIPQILLEELGWNTGDEISIEETEFWDSWGEHRGFTVANLTKNPKAREDENN